MKLDPRLLGASSAVFDGRSRPGHTATQRIEPRPWQYDWLVLRTLSDDINRLIAAARSNSNADPERVLEAVDVGSAQSPYREPLSCARYRVRTLDLDDSFGADLIGTADNTGLPTASIDLVVSTQVLEHTRRPWEAMREFSRIVKPGGLAIISVPHVWFYHPHPGDFWRVTPEGMVALCEDNDFEVCDLLLQGGTIAGVAQVIAFALFGVLGRLGAPIYLVINALGALGDRLMPNPLFSLNVAVLARRRGNADG